MVKENFPIPKQREHLKGAKPILVCIAGKNNDFGDEAFDKEMAAEIEEIEKKFVKREGVHNVEYNTDPDKLEAGFVQNKDARCILSPIDNWDKFSKDLLRCTGIVVAGIDKDTGENISFLSHQDPESYLTNGNSFISDLKAKLLAMKERCLPGTIDAVIIGGNINAQYAAERRYLNQINLLSARMEGILGFEPVIVNGPVEDNKLGDHIYYENETRRLYFVRPKINKASGDFVASEAKNFRDTWETTKEEEELPKKEDLAA